MMDVTRSARGEVVIRIDGTFDSTAATRLTGRLGEVSSSETLVIDFTKVRDCQDFGLAAVARDLACRDHLIVRGLTRHQQRMLKYFGVHLAPAERESLADEEAPL